MGMLQKEFLNNSVHDYLVAGGIFLAVYLGLLLLKKQVLDRLRRRAEHSGDSALLEDLVDQFRGPEAPLIAFYFAVRQLELRPVLSRWLYIFVVVIVAYRLIKILQDIVAFSVRRAMMADSDPVHQGTVRNLLYLTDGLIWLAGLLIVCANFGINVATLLTGLGITGVAVALGAQAILGDLFSAIAIFLDKPFVIGDLIAMDEKWLGTVEHIGIKTTRVRAMSGEMLVFSNALLTSTKLRNYRHLRERRILFTFGVSRDMGPDKIRRVSELAKEIISKTPQVRLDRVHFKGIGEFSFDFEVVYYVLDSDYTRYMDINEAMLLSMIEAFKREGIVLAYPTRVMIQAAA